MTAASVIPYFDALGHPCPEHTNPADHVINLVNTDFIQDSDRGMGRINEFAAAWTAAHDYHDPEPVKIEATVVETGSLTSQKNLRDLLWKPMNQTWILMERNVLNYSRNLLAYGVRLGMYRELVFAFLPLVSRLKRRLFL